MLKTLLTLIFCTSMLQAAEAPIDWKMLPPIPDKEGFAGSFAGIIDGKLLVAGGANFPGAKPWEGGTKIWYDRIFLLNAPGAKWQEIGNLPRRLGYGSSITTPDGLIVIGGSDSESHHIEVFRISLGENNAPVFTALPPLPKPLANTSAALLGSTIYLVGGIEFPDSTAASASFFSLDLSAAKSAWKTEPVPPFAPRMLASAGAQDGSFFIVGGASLKAGQGGKPERIWLKDAHRFTPAMGWRRIADAPQITVAAPTPMPAIGNHTLLLLGGDDSSQLATPPTSHPGFPKIVHAYHTTTDTWRPFGEMPAALVTAPTVRWNGNIVIPGGEIKPGTRSTAVLSGEILPHESGSRW